MSAIPSSSRTSSDAIAGLREGLLIAAVSGPFALLFGAIAIKNGFSVREAVLMSAAIYGGASQLVGLELFGHHVAPWLVVLSIFAVNFRHVLYSASIGRRLDHWSTFGKAISFFFLVDPQYAEGERRAEQGKTLTAIWYFAMAVPIYMFWVLNTWIGATFGNLISNPKAIGIDFMLPIYFLGMVMEFRDRGRFLPIVATSALGSVAAYKLLGSPWHVPLGALAAVLLAAALPAKAAAAA